MTTAIKRIGAIAAGVSILGLGSGIALAQSSSTTGSATASTAANQQNYPAPMTVSVDQNGYALVRGVVQSASAGQLVISSWGGAWTVQTDINTTLAVPAGQSGSTTAIDLSGVRVGDFVGVNGYVGQDQGLTVTATFVRDWTTNPYAGTGIYGGTMIPADSSSTNSS